MKKLLVYLKGYIKESVLGPLFKLLEAAFELIVPLVVASIIDNGIAGADGGYIVTRILIMITLGVVGLACSITAQYFAAKAAVGFAAKLRRELFSHIQELSFSEIDEIGTARLINRMTSDVNSVQGCVNMVLRLFLRSPFIVFGAMIMAFSIDVKCALIFCVAIPVLMAVVFGIMIASIPLYRKVQERLDAILKTTRENLNGTRVIRAFNKEEDEINAFNGGNASLTGIQVFAGKISALMNPITFAVINAAMAVLIYTGAVRVNIGRLSQGQVIALVNYMSQILVELVKLASLIIQITKALASANRVQEIFEIKPSMEFPESSPENTDSPYAVEFENVALTYKNGGAEALADIDFKVKKGEPIGIIGGTGSGKSSLVHMIPRFYDATAGEVRVDGINVKNYAKDDLRGKIAIVMQKAVLFNGTIRENMRWGKPDATDAEIREALKCAQAAEFVGDKEGELDYMIAQGGRNLSGGQRQRLTIARALVSRPQILILDDSSSALDYATDAKLREAIGGLGGKLTTFIVSQRTASLRSADRIIVMEDGAVAGIGTHEELLAGCTVYKEIYGTDSNSEEGGAHK
ncbi:MAG: ABC transporter ATP-binding protein/permease [Butyrivibrio sp.]|nr:ABC transporter ATP-binding protein/permease [Butyrivibrio sp.]